VTRLLCSALAAIVLIFAPTAQAQEDEDHQSVCPLLTRQLLQIILPEVTGHGTCNVRCEGCGCKGGPGYRDRDHKCVGYANLIQRCGPPPHSGCVAECAPVSTGCDHGRVWVKNTLARAGLSAQFTPANARALAPAQQHPLQDANQP
jgi:hypothetical protein